MNCLSGSQQWMTTTYPSPSHQNSLFFFPQRRCFSFSLRPIIPPPPNSLLTERISVTELEEDDVLHDFFKERELNGDLITKVSDRLWLREVIDFVDAENSLSSDDTQLLDEPSGDEVEGGFLKLTKTSEWLLGDNTAPVNRKVVNQELQNNKERKKRLNLLRYKALKKELLLLTVGIGFACSGYCLVTLSIQAAVSYATGVFFSCVYLQLLCQHTDKISKEMVPQIFRQKKTKKIGIRSQDLEDSLEKFIKGSSLALSSPRLVIPAVIYLLWGISQHFTKDFFDFQLVPAMVGVFAYKAAALVQVYRDNEDLQLIFPENE